jgi:predicted nucleic acid-binding Zn ribbon protein
MQFNELFEDWIEAKGLSQKMLEAKIVTEWSEIVGEQISKHTDKVSVRIPKIYLKIDVSTLKNYLFMEREMMVQKINEYLGKDTIDEIVFL